MHFTYFLIPALASAVALEARQEYRWCEGEKINAGSLRKWNWRIRGVDTGKVCNGDPFGGIKGCLSSEGCAPSSGGFNCGQDASGYIHGGVNVGLGCNGDTVKRCIDQNVGISGNTDYQCREVS